MKKIFWFITFLLIYVCSYALEQEQCWELDHNAVLTKCFNEMQAMAVSQDAEIIAALDGQTILLTDIIESFFSDRSLIELAQDRFVPAEKNKVRADLAAKWEKNAATRIGRSQQL